MRPLLLLGAVLATGLITQVRGQSAVEQLQISGTEVSDNQVVVAVSALDGAGNPVEGLSQGDFTALLDDEPLEILSLQPEVDSSLPLALIIVMDTSGSMAGGPLDAAKQAIQPVLESLRAGDRAALISFAETVTTTVPLTGDTDSLRAGLASLVAEGNTALYAAVAEAANLAASAPEPRRAMVLLSDGEDFGNVSSVTRDDSLGALAFSGVPAIVLALGDQTDVDYLSAVAGSEANLLTASAAADLAALYEQVSARLFLQYSLRIALPADVEPGIHELAIVSGGVVATASISVAGSTAPSAPRLEGLPEPLEADASVSVVNSPPGATFRVLVDGEAIVVAGGAFTLDPFAFSPGTHELRVEFSPPGSAEPIVTQFTVGQLAPLLLEPAEGTRVHPGDVVRLRFRTQPGPVTATFLLDGAVTGEATAAPYEYLVPGNLSPGDHQLEIRLTSEGGEVGRS
ncbi:MAG: VWA domain-containing protein, partial [Dehalococcoidia bacterium]